MSNLTDLDITAYALVSSCVETGTNGLIAFGRAVHPFVLAAGGVAVLRAIAGSADPETLHAAIEFLRDNTQVIAAFIASDSQITAWLEWIVTRIRGILSERE